MEKRKVIAVIGSGGEWSSLPVIRELGRNGHIIHVLFHNIKAPAVYSKYITGGIHKIPNKLDKQLVNIILYICQKERVRYIICLDEEIKYLLISNKDKLVGFKYAFPPRKSYELALRKRSSSAFAENLGIPVPKTLRPSNKNELLNIKHDFKTPLVIKGERGNSSSHIRYAYSKEELVTYFEEITNLEKEIVSASSPPMIQEYIGGPTYLTQAIAQNGKVKVVIPHYKFREWPLTGGVTARAKTIFEPKLVEYTERMMEELNWNGEAGMEWKYDESKDDFFFMEMNPRFEGSLDIAVKAGVNLPILLMELINGKEIKENIQYTHPIHYRLFFRNDFKCFLHGKYSVSTLLQESISPSIHGEISFDDIGVLRGLWQNPFRQIIGHLRDNL